MPRLDFGSYNQASVWPGSGHVKVTLMSNTWSQTSEVVPERKKLPVLMTTLWRLPASIVAVTGYRVACSGILIILGGITVNGGFQAVSWLRLRAAAVRPYGPIPRQCL